LALFTLVCLDRPGGLDLRMATRDAHLAWAGARMDQLKMGGPLLDEAGAMIGSLMIVEADDLASAKAFSADDPYTHAGLFQSVEIRGFRVTLGQPL
jgi:uncharacterized protein YciI